MVVTGTVAYLYFSDIFDFSDVLQHGVFQALSIDTTTGFSTAAYSH
jgi:Trk-type K+ transport system membrane component